MFGDGTMTTQSNAYQFASPLQVAVNARWAERILLLSLLVGIDLLMVLLGFWVAYTLRFESGIGWFYQHQVAPESYYQWVVFLLAPVWIVTFVIFGLYNFRNLFSGMEEYTRAFNASTLAIMTIIFLTFF
jgi:FlaA1/EpsC-like NDP-sugar epimerase